MMDYGAGCRTADNLTSAQLIRVLAVSFLLCLHALTETPRAPMHDAGCADRQITECAGFPQCAITEPPLGPT